MVSLSAVWFTVKERKWRIGFFGKFFWTGSEQLWDSDNCTVSIAGALENKCLIAVRSSQLRYSRYMQKQVLLRYMLGFEISKVPLEPRMDVYVARKHVSKRREGPKKRWVLQLDDKHWVWEWAREGEDIVNSAIYQLYREIVDTLKQTFTVTVNGNVFRVQNEPESADYEVLPVIAVQLFVNCMVV